MGGGAGGDASPHPNAARTTESASGLTIAILRERKLPQEGASMVEITGRYVGDLRCEATHGPSGTKLATDAPADNMGKGELFSPTDLVATALGTCVVTTMAIVANRRGVDFSAARFRVEK